MTKKNQRTISDDELQNVSGAGGVVDIDTDLVRTVDPADSPADGSSNTGNGNIMLNPDTEAESDVR